MRPTGATLNYCSRTRTPGAAFLLLVYLFIENSTNRIDYGKVKKIEGFHINGSL